MSEQAATQNQESDRRVWVRYPCNLKTLYQPGSGRLDHRWWFAKVCDISTSGMGMIVRRRFEPGTQLSVALHSQATSFSRTLEATIVHAVEHTEGWLMGCAFATPLTNGELQAYWGDQRLAEAVE